MNKDLQINFIFYGMIYTILNARWVIPHFLLPRLRTGLTKHKLQEGPAIL